MVRLADLVPLQGLARPGVLGPGAHEVLETVVVAALVAVPTLPVHHTVTLDGGIAQDLVHTITNIIDLNILCQLFEI